jgi:hypothetical protein
MKAGNKPQSQQQSQTDVLQTLYFHIFDRCQIIKQRLHKNHNLYNLNNKFVSLAILLGNRMCIPYLFF